MRIILDTSALSESLRRKKKPNKNQKSLLITLIENEEEILSGITNKKLYEDIKEILIELPYIEPAKDDYIKAAELRNKLLKKGVTTGTIDVLIASVAINNNCFLLTRDKDFEHMSKYSDLKLMTPEKYKKIKVTHKVNF